MFWIVQTPSRWSLILFHRLIALGKVARRNFPLSGTIPHVAQAGETFYVVGLIVGIVLWGFAIIWFVIAVVMIAMTYPFPFNMGWWGFIFPVGKFQVHFAQGVPVCSS